MLAQEASSQANAPYWMPEPTTQHTPRKLPKPIYLANFQKRCDNLRAALTAWQCQDAQNKEVEEVVEAAAAKLAALEMGKATAVKLAKLAHLEMNMELAALEM